jgi:DNA polymerase III epsilon subunit-like protein
MGQNGTDWKATSHSQLPKELGGGSELSHHALEDAVEEADLFQRLLDQNRTRSEPNGE